MPALLIVVGVGWLTSALEKSANKGIGQDEIIITITVRRGAMVFAMLASLCFVAGGYFILSPRRLFHDGWRYVPPKDYILGFVCILFFGYCFIASIIRLIKPKVIMQISKDGLVVPNGGKNQRLIVWEDIWEVKRTDRGLCIWLENPARYPADSTDPPETSVYVSIRSINYKIDDVERLIRSKLTSPPNDIVNDEEMKEIMAFEKDLDAGLEDINAGRYQIIDIEHRQNTYK